LLQVANEALIKSATLDEQPLTKAETLLFLAFIVRDFLRNVTKTT
jgi:hypothetical protein